MNDQSHTNAKRIRRIHHATYHATPEQVFPLLCPVKEYDWLEHWQCELVYSKSGVAEMDCIFKTFFDPTEPEVWTVTRYDKNQCIQFIIANSSRFSRFTITLTPDGNGNTEAVWEEIMTSLNAKGDEALEAWSEDVYARRREDISERLEHYLQTGHMLHRAGETRDR
ncbi:hypothetical protein JW948_16375 [bacterium]|nr:hypothetical protein [bacterium]